MITSGIIQYLEENMKKSLVIPLIILMISSLLLCDLKDYYKKGSITLKGVENFGKNNDWEDFFMILIRK